MSKLKELFLNNDGFKKQKPDAKQVLLQMVQWFESDPHNLYRTGTELHYQYPKVSSTRWESFLKLEPTKAYIKVKMDELLEVGHRKMIATLASQVEDGNISAAKELRAMAEEGNGQNRTVVILHSIPRPQPKGGN